MSDDETTHTPGPWAAIDIAVGDNSAIYVESGQDTIAALATQPDVSDKETFANARLIAAAPELLEAARWAREHVNDPKALDVINEAIDKATSDHANGQS